MGSKPTIASYSTATCRPPRVAVAYLPHIWLGGRHLSFDCFDPCQQKPSQAKPNLTSVCPSSLPTCDQTSARTSETWCTPRSYFAVDTLAMGVASLCVEQPNVARSGAFCCTNFRISHGAVMWVGPVSLAQWLVSLLRDAGWTGSISCLANYLLRLSFKWCCAAGDGSVDIRSRRESEREAAIRHFRFAYPRQEEIGSTERCSGSVASQGPRW